MKNRKLALMLSMTLALGSVTNSFAAVVPETLKVKTVQGRDAKIKYLQNEKFIEGYGNGDFGYGNDITRSQITKLLVYANGQEHIAKQLEKIKGIMEM